MSARTPHGEAGLSGDTDLSGVAICTTMPVFPPNNTQEIADPVPSLPPSHINPMVLPTELWLLIFDIVISEGIVRLNHCNHLTFPYTQDFSMSPRTTHSQSYDSYRRLRLVCHRFRAMLGEPVCHTIAEISVITLVNSTRVLVLALEPLPTTHIQRLLPLAQTCDKLVFLDITCGSLPPDLHRASLFDLLSASAERTFHTVQRLTIRLLNKPYALQKGTFWALLHRSFPLLVTLAVTMDRSYKHCTSLGEEVNPSITFETLEILRLDSAIMYLGCHLPRLKHASIPIGPDELEVLLRSPNLESLLIPELPFPPHSFDLGQFPNLKLLGFREGFEYLATSTRPDHPLEHIWLFGVSTKGNYTPIQEIIGRFPGISRLTVDLSWVSWRSERRNEEVRQMRLGSTGLSIIPPKYEGDPIVEFERNVDLKAGVLEQLWKKMRLHPSSNVHWPRG